MFSAQIDARFWEWVCNGLELWVCAFKWVFVPGCEYCTISLRMLLRRNGVCVSACLWVHACVRRSAGLKRFCLNFRCAFLSCLTNKKVFRPLFKIFYFDFNFLWATSQLCSLYYSKKQKKPSFYLLSFKALMPSSSLESLKSRKNRCHCNQACPWAFKINFHGLVLYNPLACLVLILKFATSCHNLRIGCNYGKIKLARLVRFWRKNSFTCWFC